MASVNLSASHLSDWILKFLSEASQLLQKVKAGYYIKKDLLKVAAENHGIHSVELRSTMPFWGLYDKLY